jgi:signal transduction histidine kinase
MLAARTGDLLRANEELALAARTSAIGSVAAHLIHGLKNPLSGLHQFVKGQGGAEPTDATVWAAAAASTRRMQQMVSDVVRVLREEQAGAMYELSLPEFEELFRQRIEPLARDAAIDFQISRNAEAQLNNLQANLLVLILGNLVQNAIQASPPKGLVTLGIGERGTSLEFRVIDQGAGLPVPVKNNLFAPCSSSKDGGTGIGLAISRQLAAHLGAELTLESSGERGSVFVLLLSLRQNFTGSPLEKGRLKS